MLYSGNTLNTVCYNAEVRELLDVTSVYIGDQLFRQKNHTTL